jgi:HK97 family phage portal protein
MKIFGLTVMTTKSAQNLVPVRSQSWLSVIRESFTGAWQRNVEVESTSNILTFSGVYACLTLIAGDIAKLRIKLVEMLDDIWEEVDAQSPFIGVLRKPNAYQTRIQFFEQWVICKLIHGNTYVLKERDARGIVTAMYILDQQRVQTLVAESGDVYYRLSVDYLSGVMESVTVPASEIIHDRMNCLWHPLIGVPPLYACAASTTQGIRIQANSAKFFENMSRPSGQLTAPGAITDANAKRLKDDFEKNFSGSNIGRLLVTGDGLKYEPMAFPPEQAQMIEQLRFTVEDVARTFHVPLHKLGMGQPTLNNIGALNQDYYTQTLQTHIEAIELLLDEGLGLINVPGKTLGTEFDLDGLLRMDPLSRADKNEKAIRAGYLAPNEARASENLPEVDGGETPYLQQQNYSLSALSKRDAQADPFGTAKPAVTPALPAPAPSEPAPVADDNAKAVAELRAELAMREALDTARKGFEHV